MMTGVTSFLSAGKRADPDPDQTLFMFEDDLGMAPLWSRAITAWLNSDPRARMLLSRSGRIHWANDAAHRILRENGSFRALNDVLVCDGEATSSILARLLQDAPMDGAIYAVISAGEDRQWLLWAQQLVHGDDGSIGLAMHRMADPVSYEAMLRMHHLTPSETRIVTMMLAGMETGRIAQKQDISIETLRTHIKHAYRKLDVRSRGELFAKAVHFAGL